MSEMKFKLKLEIVTKEKHIVLAEAFAATLAKVLRAMPSVLYVKVEKVEPE